ncbi:MAG: nucleotide sugar dehydrogenase [bacterium]|nr:nucleotide sugar dehydrogenase [bacterium]
MEHNFQYDLCIVGGAGHVGLPLGVVFADSGVKTVLLDINQEALKKIMGGEFPFIEKNGNMVLRSALAKKMLFASDSSEVISQSKFVVIIVGTPVDEFLNPDFRGITKLFEESIKHFRDGQVLIIRSTVFPGTTEKIQKYFKKKNIQAKVTFCPERIAEGYAVEELRALPQLVSAYDDEGLREVTELFRKISPKEPIAMKPIEAELAKLFINSWRYIKFAVANQFFMIAQNNGLNFHIIQKAMSKDYPRDHDLPAAGFAAGPCLFKDTMQLSAFTHNHFLIGNAAMLVNEGLVNHVVHELKREFSDSLSEKTVAILGMAFKPELDDPRSSLSYKLRKMLLLECDVVLCTDEFIKDPRFVPLDVALRDSDIIVLATPHKKYQEIDPRKHPNKKFVDVWNFWKLS